MSSKGCFPVTVGRRSVSSICEVAVAKPSTRPARPLPALRSSPQVGQFGPVLAAWSRRLARSRAVDTREAARGEREPCRRGRSADGAHVGGLFRRRCHHSTIGNCGGGSHGATPSPRRSRHHHCSGRTHRRVHCATVTRSATCSGPSESASQPRRQASAVMPGGTAKRTDHPFCNAAAADRGPADGYRTAALRACCLADWPRAVITWRP